MASDEIDEHQPDGPDDRADGPNDSSETGERMRETAADEVDQRIVDLLSWILDTETRAKIYVYLLANPGSTSEEVAKGTGLYPSTVREALAELNDEDRVIREKRASEGAGNNPYEYTAIQPSDLVGGVVDQVQQELNTIFTLDRLLDRDGQRELEDDEDAEPVTITVDEDDVAALEEEFENGESNDAASDDTTETDSATEDPSSEDQDSSADDASDLGSE
ncbi:helix-turn-helix domain-containing protein [Halostagnicola sp. A-GB9-2]|uniref:helix-turn-helix domain-containing protein n=1 Tax=Halostagnicola sp. A-GB9-2 TaxID=3048066 RepID=UPI0024C0B9DC|nr:helix-turn-helix domain-containing protein [Halostagnicola sp. A-GB9-2]MDJ1432043.1 helix-turn-helix domain-containing protein [Halostagnicola sp. A-GB9-2]